MIPDGFPEIIFHFGDPYNLANFFMKKV